MPEERTFTIRGQNPAATTHTKIQLSTHTPMNQYLIVDFKIQPAGTPTNSDCYGIITMGKDDAIDPSDPNYADQNEIAWSHSSVRQPVPPGIAESVSFYNDSLHDIKLFAYDIWLHTEDALNAEAVNYYIVIKRYRTSAEAGAITSLRQYMYNPGT